MLYLISNYQYIEDEAQVVKAMKQTTHINMKKNMSSMATLKKTNKVQVKNTTIKTKH